MRNNFMAIILMAFLSGCASQDLHSYSITPPHPLEDLNHSFGKSGFGSLDDPEILSETSDSKRVLIRVFEGDTIEAIFERSSVESNILSLLGNDEKELLMNINSGDIIEITTDNKGNLIRLAKTIKGSENDWSVFKKVKGEYKVSKKSMKSTYSKRYVQGKVKYNLYETARKLDIDQSVIREMSNILKNEINLNKKSFQGDTFKIIYCQMRIDGYPVGEPIIMAIEYIQKNRVFTAYRFKENDAYIYYDENGKDLQKGFLKEPLEYTVISSPFSKKRWHPVLNRYREHHGVDFAAPIGTKIFAPARGVVSFIGEKNGYGNVIEIKHGNSIKTLYGHLSGFKGGLREGDKVAQGDIIAYVGNTGISTGPHLHYEFIKNDEPVDPLSIDISSVENLDGQDFFDFKKSISELKREMVGIKDINPDRMLSFDWDVKKDDALM